MVNQPHPAKVHSDDVELLIKEKAPFGASLFVRPTCNFMSDAEDYSLARSLMSVKA